MLRPLVLTGGPAVGKSTCARLLAEALPRAAVVDADDVRQLVVAGAAAPWQGHEGQVQHALGAQNAAGLARGLHGAGFAVVVADVVTPATAAVYRVGLPGCLLVHLRISQAGARRRAATRTVHLTDAEFVLLHDWQAADPPRADVVLDVDGLSLAEQVAEVRRLWEAAGDGQGAAVGSSR
ncbi:hypothetical protein SAMN04488543_0746 [Friedmanniella luteola]|uniref:Shikimate kinase n=1 Tax=Friedmanniella luteola TaxID=546871 RepID=A0A1H1MYW2_9ACTN|nr:hypothetical protein [Friedmanniella luteola]SDR91817.1 hypothetical protein SAMN04488543_0746 [Friedmanniella luteola]